MNWIELNGVKSTDIKGLLISSLPPITKPMMRSMVEEIDGRDGDIITKLGYSAYDKKMEIGLFGDYDVDAVIEYFNSEGQVVFSNEPGKYYRYQILQQIDLEKLLRFKKATVVFHVQPFKYSAVNEVLSFQDIANNSEIDIVNRGNIYSKPIITIHGSGLFYLSFNTNINTLKVNFGSSSDYLTIDVETMNAYRGNTLKNRSIECDYKNMLLNVGQNTIKVTLVGGAAISQIDIENYSRWL